MVLVRIVGHKKGGRYIAHEVPPKKAAEIIKKLETEPEIIRVESQRTLPPPKFTNNTKI